MLPSNCKNRKICVQIILVLVFTNCQRKIPFTFNLIHTHLCIRPNPLRNPGSNEVNFSPLISVAPKFHPEVSIPFLYIIYQLLKQKYLIASNASCFLHTMLFYHPDVTDRGTKLGYCKTFVRTGLQYTVVMD